MFWRYVCTVTYFYSHRVLWFLLKSRKVCQDYVKYRRYDGFDTKRTMCLCCIRNLVTISSVPELVEMG